MAKRTRRRRPVGRGSVYPERGQWRAAIRVHGRRLRRLVQSEDEAWEVLEELRRAASAGIDIDWYGALRESDGADSPGHRLARALATWCADTPDAFATK